MSSGRDIVHAAEALALKVASRTLVRGSGGGEGAAATIAAAGGGARQQRMSDCGNPNTPDFLRIDEVATLEDVTVGQPNHPIVTRTMARRQGFALVRLPERLPQATDLLALLAEQAKENGDIAALILAALADGKVTRREAGSVRPQVHEAIAVLVAMDAELAIIEAEGSE
ncbi:MAG: hypothetical protein OSB00_07760 [Sphingomonas bacterium]|nr:hypothetical protein [Sphingomonas bacterium]